MRWESIWQCVPEVRPSQLGKWCQLVLGFDYWVHLGAVFDGKKMYLMSITLIKTYTALSWPLGDRMGWMQVGHTG